ncbi:MAG: amidase [Sneathiella sp.]|nr:amidase [Sneathiella sp.]
MSITSLAEMSAIQLLAGFTEGLFTPADLLEVCLDRIERLNPAIGALTSFDTERARAEARLSTQRWHNGAAKGPLDGLPIGVKDLQETKGLLTTYGNPLFRANVPIRDLPMVAKLRQAGAIVTAKTNVPELGAGGNSRNPVWGATGNPFDPVLIAGGSSGGSAAALAADLLPLCTGSDTGGSLRLPAAICGVVGYRPSADLVAHPTRPLGWSVISVLGPMARSMDDMILMLRAIQGYDANDPLSGGSQPSRLNDIPDIPLDRLRVGISADFGGAPVHPAIRETFMQRVEAIAPHVAECRPIDMNLGGMDRVFDILRAESFVAAFEADVRAKPENFGPHIITNVNLGRAMTLSDRAWAHAEQTRILRLFNARMEDFDIVVMPTTPVSPFPWTQSHPEEIDGQAMDIYYRWLALTYRGSLTGGPALTIPAGRDHKGMPFGLQILGKVRGDALLLGAGKAIERLLERDPETARPRPDLLKMVAAAADLRAIVTHPPVLDGAGSTSKSTQTAV